ncbi:cupin domain-containing protein [Pseudomonas aeruginosa]|uniref:cupin domain-containing protein n=1 Tax=Pseudomonas aeruginosa TaxID=287 RepID=UPI000FC41DC2|nr:cupin domain-containing protein [Pseudomonas aeruginosa]RUI15284.1 cupin domain-containing protein [Pseudomonas aeruginosa]
MPSIRVVTGHDALGRALLVSEGALPGTEPFEHSPGFSAALVWRTHAGASVGVDGRIGDCAPGSVLPEPGGSCALLVTFPAQSSTLAAEFDGAAAARELVERLPGLGERFEADGFHRTDSIDYGVVLDGEIWLELDHGRQVQLRQGDIVVQGGTRHAWRNRGEQPARLLFVLTGAVRGGA